MSIDLPPDDRTFSAQAASPDSAVAMAAAAFDQRPGEPAPLARQLERS